MIRLSLIALALSSALQVADAHAQRFSRGFVREDEAVYRSFSGTPTYRAFLPESVDFSSRFPRPGNQGDQGSCTAWAVGYATRSFYEGRRSGWDLKSPSTLFSPAYIYNQLNRGSRSCGGTAISSALQLVKERGIATLADFPYDASDCTRAPPPQISEKASMFRISGWRTIANGKLDDVKGQLAIGNPVIFGMEISSSFDELQGDQIYDDISSPRNGGHAMVLVGYNERRQAFKVINSWGTDWGDRGFGWISYRALAQLSDRMFVVDVPALSPVVVPQPVVEPPPKVVPVPPKVVVVDPPPKPVVVTPKVDPVPPKVDPVPPKVVVVDPPPKPVIVTPKVDPVPPKVDPVPPKVVVVDPPPKVVVVTPPKVDPTPPNVDPVPPKVVVVPPVVPVKLSLSELRQQLARKVAEIPCSRLESRVDDDWTIRISGMTGSIDAVRALEGEYRKVAGVRNVSVQALSRPWPQCEALLTFDGAFSTPRGMQVQVRSGDPAVLRAGESLVIDITTPAHPSYLYVTYVQASGDAVHLYKPEGRVPRAVPPNTKITLGADPRGPKYTIGAPYGEEMIVVVAAASPLFGADELPLQQTEREYLTQFRKTFVYRPPGTVGERTVSASSVTLRTSAR